MSVKRKLTKAMDWFLLGRPGEVFIVLALIGFCLMIAAACLLIGTGIDKSEYNQDNPQIDKIIYSGGIWI